MRDNPYVMLFGLSVLLYLGAQAWRRRRVKRAVRDLPTRMQRLLGPEPLFAPPLDLPEELADFAALHRRTGRIEWAVRGLAALWLAYVFSLLLRGTLP